MRLFVLLQLSSVEVAERAWSCRSIASLLCEAGLLETLLNHQGLPRSLIPLLLDCEWSVREAAAGALRSVSLSLPPIVPPHTVYYTCMSDKKLQYQHAHAKDAQRFMLFMLYAQHKMDKFIKT